ncbi:hypothetical protein ACYOEI_30770 [Singulisphaera rosea]
MRRTGAILAIVLCALAATTEVKAGCGHYLEPASQDGSPSILRDLQVLSEWDRIQSHLPLTPTRDLPCSGPSCSKKPVQPESPVSPTLVRTDSWCCTSIFLPVPVPECLEGLGRSPSARPLRRASALDRPPRSLLFALVSH